MEKTPLDSLVNFYEETVKEMDKNNLAEIYKFLTEKLIKNLQNEAKLDNLELTIQDLEYLDGYFIFGHGTNSVVHFRIKECPGWLFGIWWSPDNEKPTEGNKGIINCSWFAQHEKEIDKFKPSASVIEHEFKIKIPLDIDSYLDYHVKYCIYKEIKFILEEPYLAFCKDVFNYDYNLNYLSRKDAKNEFKQFYKHRKLENKYLEVLNRKVLNKVKYLFKDFIKKDDCYIYDKGEGWIPRYVINFNLSKMNASNQTWGTTEEDDFLVEEVFPDYVKLGCKKELEEYIVKLENKADKKGYIWYSPINSNLIMRVCTEENYYKMKKEIK